MGIHSVASGEGEELGEARRVQSLLGVRDRIQDREVRPVGMGRRGTIPPTPEHGDEYMDEVAYRDVTTSTKGKTEEP